MIHYGLQEEHLSFKNAFRKFVQDKIVPLIDEAETKREFPMEVYPLLREHGYLGIQFPEEYGGGGADLLMECIFVEELTRASAGVSAGVFAHTHLACTPIYRYGTEEQKQQFLVPAIRGEKIGGFGLTEPTAGSDVQSIRTTATRVEGGYVLNGEKVFITNGGIADFLLTAAYVDKSKGYRGIGIFIVDTSTKGYSAVPLKKLGNHSSNTCLVSLEDVFVPEQCVLGGEPEDGFVRLMNTLLEGRILVANRGLALAELAYEHSLAYAKQRVAFGKPIGSFQATGNKLVRLARDLDIARLLIYRAAHLFMAGQDCKKEAAMAKWFASDLAQRATTDALHIHGGYGYTEDYPLERLYRDAPESVIGEGTAEIQQRIIAKEIGLR